MSKLNFRDSTIKALRPPVDRKAEIYFDSKTEGLTLVVSAKGTKSWTARYRFLGKQQRMTIGKYTDGMGIAEARGIMLEIRTSLRNGVNPAAAKRESVKAAIHDLDNNTVRSVTDRYLEAAKEGRHKRNANKPLGASSINSHLHASKLIMPLIGDKVISELERKHLEVVLISISNDVSSGASRIVRDFLSGLFAYATYTDIISANPVPLTSKHTYAARSRVLADNEMSELLSVLRTEEAPVSVPLRIAIELCAYSLCRTGEVAEATMDEFNLKERIWNIKPERTKNGRGHTVPLNDHMIALIEAALSFAGVDPSRVDMDHTVPLFPSPIDKSKPIQAAAMTKAFTRIKPLLGYDDVRLHDLRRAGGSGLAELGFSGEVISRVLNHTFSVGASVTREHYAHYPYLNEKRLALEAWASRLNEISGETLETTNVINFR